MLADDRPTTGRLSADCRPTIGRRLTSCVCLGAVYGHCAHDKDWNIILQRAKLWLTEITVEGLVESLMPVTRCCVCPNSLELSPEACVFKSIEMWENVGLPFRNGYSDSPIMLYLDQKGDAGPCASRIRMHCCASLTLAHLDGQEQIQESRQHCQASPSLPSPAQWHKLTTLASAHLHYIYGCTSAYKDICSKGTITYGSNTVRTVLIQFFPGFCGREYRARAMAGGWDGILPAGRSGVSIPILIFILSRQIEEQKSTETELLSCDGLVCYLSEISNG